MSDDNAGASASSSGTSQPPRFNTEALERHLITHKINFLSWIIRLFTILFTLAYFVPIFGDSSTSYYRALLANAAINALRLHQRLGPARLSREFLAELLSEDSCHYLFYSMIFIYVGPVSLVLLPVLLFAVLQFSSYSLTLLDTLGQNRWWGARLMISLIEFQSLNILRLAAFTEIILMPCTVILVLMGRASLLTPFIYYHFLTQRYTSRRNPYNRNLFLELRYLIERTAAKPSVPSFAKQILLGIISLTIKLAPPQVAQPPPQHSAQQ